MSEITEKNSTIDLQAEIKTILDTIDQEREREIITRRFGIYDRKETLEQIGELLGITRERVRQLEKSILQKLKASTSTGKIKNITMLEKQIIKSLFELGRVARISDLTDHIVSRPSSPRERAYIAFISELAPNITVVNENDNFHHSAGIAEHGDDEKIKECVEEIVKTIKKHGEPISVDELHTKLNYEHPSHIRAYASLSKSLANLKDNWGLVKWPTVNPKNIRDKIYVILAENGSPMHFSDIAKSIKDSSFKRKNVTTQAIHNELIKDNRFVLIGRGIYALDNWGFSRGTVAEIIAEILKKSETPLHRDKIVEQVLQTRQVKETTILLNLQNKPEFKRVAKATYIYESVQK